MLADADPNFKFIKERHLIDFWLICWKKKKKKKKEHRNSLDFSILGKPKEQYITKLTYPSFRGQRNPSKLVPQASVMLTYSEV